MLHVGTLLMVTFGLLLLIFLSCNVFSTINKIDCRQLPPQTVVLFVSLDKLIFG